MFGKSNYSLATIRLHGVFSYLFLVVANYNFDISKYQPGFPAVTEKTHTFQLSLIRLVYHYTV